MLYPLHPRTALSNLTWPFHPRPDQHTERDVLGSEVVAGGVVLGEPDNTHDGIDELDHQDGCKQSRVLAEGRGGPGTWARLLGSKPPTAPLSGLEVQRPGECGHLIPCSGSRALGPDTSLRR